MKTKSVRIGDSDHCEIRQWAESKVVTSQDIIHSLVLGAKSIKYQRTYERSLEKCMQKIEFTQ